MVRKTNRLQFAHITILFLYLTHQPAQEGQVQCLKDIDFVRCL